MADKVITKSNLSLQVEESDKLLPDESDQIISDLAQQLTQLKSKIAHYESEKKQNLQEKQEVDSGSGQV